MQGFGWVKSYKIEAKPQRRRVRRGKANYLCFVIPANAGEVAHGCAGYGPKDGVQCLFFFVIPETPHTRHPRILVSGIHVLVLPHFSLFTVHFSLLQRSAALSA